MNKTRNILYSIFIFIVLGKICIAGDLCDMCNSPIIHLKDIENKVIVAGPTVYIPGLENVPTAPSVINYSLITQGQWVFDCCETCSNSLKSSFSPIIWTPFIEPTFGPYCDVCNPPRNLMIKLPIISETVTVYGKLIYPPYITPAQGIWQYDCCLQDQIKIIALFIYKGNG